MFKTIICEVSCAHDFSSGHPESLRVDLGASQVLKIKRLLKAVRLAGADTITIPFPEAIWSSQVFSGGDDEQSDWTMGQLTEAIKENPVKVDCPKLVVDEDGHFYLTAIVHNRGEDYTLSTDTIEIAALDADTAPVAYMTSHVVFTSPTEDSTPPLTPYTVIGHYEETGQIFSHWIEAHSAAHAFAEVAKQHQDSDMMFTAALEGRLEEDTHIGFPGVGLVDADTVIQQPDIFC